MKFYAHLFLLITTCLISACSPHPTSGVWKSIEDNDYGLKDLTVSFDGKANFTTSKLYNATWHCFWSPTSKQETVLDCTPSSDPEQEERFTLTINSQGLAELRHNDQLITLLTLQDKNPSPEN